MRKRISLLALALLAITLSLYAPSPVVPKTRADEGYVMCPNRHICTVECQTPPVCTYICIVCRDACTGEEVSRVCGISP